MNKATRWLARIADAAAGAVTDANRYAPQADENAHAAMERSVNALLRAEARRQGYELMADELDLAAIRFYERLSP